MAGYDWSGSSKPATSLCQISAWIHGSPALTQRPSQKTKRLCIQHKFSPSLKPPLCLSTPSVSSIRIRSLLQVWNLWFHSTHALMEVPLFSLREDKMKLTWINFTDSHWEWVVTPDKVISSGNVKKNPCIYSELRRESVMLQHIFSVFTSGARSFSRNCTSELFMKWFLAFLGDYILICVRFRMLHPSTSATAK